MDGGYPTLSDIITYIATEGVEEITDGNNDFRTEFMQLLWSLLNRTGFASALGVHLPSSATFNVRDGKYVWKGVVKTYAHGSDVNPTDNDTTYIWMTASNTISSGIDGSGWPTTEHIPLAEIDVDSDGVITAVRDLRGQTFLRALDNAKPLEAHTAGDTLTVAESGSVHTNLGATGAVTLILPASAPAGTVFHFAVQAAYELRIDPGTAAIRDDSGATADKYKSADAIGECITLIADANGDWATIAKNGTWTEEA